jgi:hypothetical protein
MLPERARVSRKTPKDGKLEISDRAAAVLSVRGSGFDLVVNGAAGRAVVTSMACTCRGGDGEHVHYFLQSELLKVLPPESEVSIDLLSSPGTVVMAST